MKRVLLTFISYLFLLAANAQFQTAAINGLIAPGEYANTWADGGGRTFYMTWDETNLYFAVSGLTNPGDGILLHIDTDPQPLANSGTPANGSISAPFFVDGVEYGQLPFRSNFYSFCLLGQSRLFRSDGAGGWIDPFVSFPRGEPDPGDPQDVREFSIPWTEINGVAGLPASFNIFFRPPPTIPSSAYYGGCSNPADNDFADITNLTGRHYFNVGATDNPLAGDAFSRLCFINSRVDDELIYGFGATNTYWDVASADNRILLIDKDITVQNQLRTEGGSVLRPAGDRTVTFTGTTGSIFNSGFMDANPFFGNTLNYIINGTVTLDAASTSNIDVYNMTINGTLNLNGETLRTGNFGTVTVGAAGTLNAATGLLGTYGTDPSNFVMSGAASLIIGSPDGISAAPSATGSVQTSSRTFSTTGAYTYTSASAQVTGSGLPATVGQLNAVNTPNVTLSNPVAVTGSVALNNGFLSLNGNNLTLTGATISRTAPGHIVTYNGTTAASVIRNNITGTFTFPVGTSLGAYTPATVAPVSASTFSVGVFSPAAANGVAGGPAFAPADLVKFVNATWNVDRTAGTGDAQLQLGWPAALEGSTFTTLTDAQLGISRYDGSSWLGFVQDPGTGDNTLNTVAATFSAFSPFIVGPANLVLPVTFTSFRGVLENGKARLNWTAEESDNLSHYEVERSTNGSLFGKTARVDLSAATGRGSYLAFDEKVTRGATFYRIAAVGKDGDRRYSATIRLNAATGVKTLQLLPSADVGILAFRLNGLEKGTYAVQVFTSGGQLVYSTQLPHDGAEQTRTLNLGRSLPAGVYQLVIKGEGTVLSQGFVK